MKKVTDFLRPNILIVLGALLFLYYLNYLSYEGSALAIGIIAVVLSAYYLAIGIVGVLLSNKLNQLVKKIFEVVSVSLFGAFMFTVTLILIINAAKIEDFLGPTGWIIGILTMVASIALIGVYALARFLNKEIFVRLAYLFSAIFALVLLLNVLFDISGNSIVLGSLDILLVAIYASFTFYLFNSLVKPESAAE